MDYRKERASVTERVPKMNQRNLADTERNMFESPTNSERERWGQEGVRVSARD